ncbi:NYN domain-containing protein [bacterium]|nr:MAG: NYN domain-containing protein [bacterium]
MFYAAKHLYGSKLNFTRLLDYVSKGRPLTRAISYIIKTPEIDQSNFITMLRSNGYEVRVKELKQRPDGSAKGDWDMGLALDALAMAERLDVIAIVSGDGDFVDLVNLLKARGVRVEVYSFPYSTAEELRSAATEFYQMGPEVVMNPQARLTLKQFADDGVSEEHGEHFQNEPDFFIESVGQA